MVLTACQKGTSGDDPEPNPTPTPTPTGEKTEPVAGSGTAGSADGPLATAQFSQPKGIVLDAAGNMFVADWGNERIRKVSVDGQVTNLAGSTKGFIDGKGAAAKFNEPSDVAVDGQGNVYVADINNNAVRKIAPDGTVSTFAGAATQGYADGTGTAARFNNPRGVAVDAQGNVYVADMTNNCIRKITPAGVVSTFAGAKTAGYADGTGTAARFTNPRDLTVDGQGNIYVVDSDNNGIRKITPAGVVTTIAGGSGAGFSDGAGATAKFNEPKGIVAAADGTLYIADTENNRIRRVSTTGVVTTLAGDGTAGYAEGATTTARFNAPRGIALDASGKVLYIVDQDNNRIRKIALK
ncbi:hypothetical protein BUE76_06455 [Cnuella takakiae]|nr:hypothetical protein BUE76_06455 [Cnuella takakiae]